MLTKTLRCFARRYVPLLALSIGKDGLLNRLLSLAKLFAEYRIYPAECFAESSTAHIFQREFADDHYAQDLKELLNLQQYDWEQRGADLPWWGENFFSATSGPKVMIIAQDSLANDAGSVVFHACFMPSMDETSYRRFRDDHNLEEFRSWGMAKGLLRQISDLKNIYLTDAAKVYRKGSCKDRDVDTELSRKLLDEEIEICEPQLIILLGGSPLALLGFKERSWQVVSKGVLQRAKRDYIVAPFPSVANSYYYGRVHKSLKLIESYWIHK